MSQKFLKNLISTKYEKEIYNKDFHFLKYPNGIKYIKILKPSLFEQAKAIFGKETKKIEIIEEEKFLSFIFL